MLNSAFFKTMVALPENLTPSHAHLGRVCELFSFRTSDLELHLPIRAWIYYFSLAQWEDDMGPHRCAHSGPGTHGGCTWQAHVMDIHGGHMQRSIQQEGEAVEDTKPTGLSELFPTTLIGLHQGTNNIKINVNECFRYCQNQALMFNI